MACIYRFLNAANEIIYVGVATNTLDSRLKGHNKRSNVPGQRHKPHIMYSEVTRIQYVECPTKTDAEMLEFYYIAHTEPPYNERNNHGQIPHWFTFDLDRLVWQDWNGYFENNKYQSPYSMKAQIEKAIAEAQTEQTALETQEKICKKLGIGA